MVDEKRNGLEIDLQKLLFAYLNKWWLILAGTVIAGVIAMVITVNFITPMYKASVTVYVNNVRSDQYVEYISSSNLATAQRLVNTYINIIESDTVLEKVAEASDLDITAGTIRGSMSAAQMDDTEIFTVTITHENPVMAAQIANAVAAVAPGEIENFVEGSSTKIIDYAKIPSRPSTPNTNRNTVLGALVGCVIMVVFVTIGFLLDVRIKDEEDLEMLFDMPVLAQIPAFAPEGKRSSSYGSSYSGYGYKRHGYGYSTSSQSGRTEK